MKITLFHPERQHYSVVTYSNATLRAGEYFLGHWNIAVEFAVESRDKYLWYAVESRDKYLCHSCQNKLLLLSLIFVHYIIWEWHYIKIISLVILFLNNITSDIIFI